MSFDSVEHRIVSVVLNYNSDSDVANLVPQLQAQKGVHQTVIIIDNASTPTTVARTRAWVQDNYPDAVIGTVTEVQNWVEKNLGQAQEHHGRVYLVLNHENRGYSAGNNIGIRLADELQADAVLIANPDMQIEDPNYLRGLAGVLFIDDKHFIAASRIIGMDGKDQNPLREPTFWEELFWPRLPLARWFGRPISYVLPVNGSQPVVVPKVSGCCLLLRTAFLKTIGFLDEAMFLYCEEPILSAKVAQYRGSIAFTPALSATHAHSEDKSGDALQHTSWFIASRKYFLLNYSRYGLVKIGALYGCYAFMPLVLRLKILMMWIKANLSYKK